MVLIFSKSYYWHIEIELSIDLESLFALKMSELADIKKDIAETKAKLKKAEDEEKSELILMYGNQLIEQQKEKNLILASQGKFLLLSLLFALSNPPFPTFVTHLMFNNA